MKDTRAARTPERSNKSKNTLVISIIGSLPPPIGGTSISLQHLVSFLQKKENVEVFVINTSGVRGSGIKGTLRFSQIISDIFKATQNSDIVSLHVATSALPWFGLLVLGVARLLKKPLIIRKFGGTKYNDKSWIAGALSHFVLKKADVYLAQTRELVSDAEKRGLSRVKWYPTSRPLPAATGLQERKHSCNRFIYLGQIRKSKGIHELIQAAEKFIDGNVIVDVYGPINFDIQTKAFSKLKIVRYCGVLEPSLVHQTLINYDALILPSYHQGEGYPGVIIEAYGAGLPVICTRWKALPEIVDDNSGLLILPRSQEALYSAMKKLTEDPLTFSRLREGAIEKSAYFSSETWGQYFVDQCRFLLSEKLAKMPKKSFIFK